MDSKHKELAKRQALMCPVLLQNNNNTLPIDKNIKTLAVIGAVADDVDCQLGYISTNNKYIQSDSITALTSLRQALPNTTINYAPGYLNVTSNDKSLFAAAIAATNKS